MARPSLRLGTREKATLAARADTRRRVDVRSIYIANIAVPDGQQPVGVGPFAEDKLWQANCNTCPASWPSLVSRL